MEIIGLTKFLPTKFCFDQRFLPSVSGGEFEMATGREEEEEAFFWPGEDFDDNFGIIMSFFFGKMRILMFNLEHPHRRDRAEFSHGRNEEILFMVIILCLLREHHKVEQFSSEP